MSASEELGSGINASAVRISVCLISLNLYKLNSWQKKFLFYLNFVDSM
jgi:hypothetical protein